MSAAYLKGEARLITQTRAGNFWCEGKVRFDSAVLARAAAERKPNRSFYRCISCGGWHAGQRRTYEQGSHVKKIVAILMLVSAPALAQSPSPSDLAQSLSPSDRAYQQTIHELTQAWVGARTALLAEQDQNAIKDTKIHELEAKLPRQEPVKGPSGVGAQ